MASPHTIERQRGAKEASQQLDFLRERWPLAFPVQPRDVHPLALGTVGQIAEAMGWSVPYTVGVLTYWKMAPVYCRRGEAVSLRESQELPTTSSSSVAREGGFRLWYLPAAPPLRGCPRR